jgi:hypothetical protein
MKQRDYRYEAVVCYVGGTWSEVVGDFTLTTRRGVASPGALPKTAEEAVRKACCGRAAHVLVQKVRALGKARTVEA